MSDIGDYDEFDLPDEFDAPSDFYPFAQAQQWGILCPGLSTGALAAYVFICVHLNLSTGKLTARFTRKRIAERFGVVLKTVDRWLAELVDAGLLEKRSMWWVDKKAKKRSSQPLAADGTKREQAPNNYRLKLTPPGGMSYAGPIHVGEFYKPQLIDERLAEARESAGQGVATSVSPPVEQGKRASTRDDPQPPQASDQQEQAKPQVGPQRHQCRQGRDMDVAGVGTYMSPKQERRELPRAEPTNQRPAAVGRGAGVPGWLDGPPQPEGQAAAPPTTGAGVRLLADLEIRHRPDRHAWPRLAPLVEALLDGGWSWDDLKRAVTAGAHTATNPPGAVIRKIEKYEKDLRAEHLSRSQLAERRKQADAEHAAEARAAAEAKALAIADCSLCDDRGYDGRHLCDHNPAAGEVHARGYAAASALLAAKKSARRQHDAAS